MCDRLVNWANLNSFTGNLLGLDRQHAALKEAFTELGGTIRSLEIKTLQHTGLIPTSSIRRGPRVTSH